MVYIILALDMNVKMHFQNSRYMLHQVLFGRENKGIRDERDI